jgi:uncharacterized protein (TIGR03067 family)
VAEAKITFDTTKSPARLDLTYTSGPLRGKTWKGIYKRNGDMLTISFDSTGRAYPREFLVSPTTSASAMYLRRASP